MTRSGNSAESLRKARREVTELRALLLDPSPERLQQRLPALEEAARSLESVLTHPAPNSARAELDALASDLRGCAKLIEHGMALQQAWAGIMRAASGGYSPDGQPAALSPRASISLRG